MSYLSNARCMYVRLIFLNLITQLIRIWLRTEVMKLAVKNVLCPSVTASRYIQIHSSFCVFCALYIVK